jgi:Fur family transcriptional regulator, stress-responsive regulator
MFPPVTSLSLERIASELRDHGLRVTAPRLAVYRAVGELPGHPDVDEIAARVRADIGSISTQTVYDGLRVLTAAGLVRRIQPAGSPARYETRVGDNHHHVVCRVCGAAHDVDCTAGAAPCLDPSETGGFSIDEAEITFWGVCPECQSERPNERTPRGAANRRRSHDSASRPASDRAPEAERARSARRRGRAGAARRALR